MRLALIPLNPTVAELEGNARRILDAAVRAREQGAEIIAFPELALTGYPPRDLLLREGFLGAVEAAADRLARSLKNRLGDAAVLVGAPRREDETLYNSVLVMRDGAIESAYDKRLLPQYDVFDERRYFKSGSGACVFRHGGRRVGLAICEDLWRAEDVPGAPGYSDQPDPLDDLARETPDVVVVASASPFVLGKDALQRKILVEAARRIGAPVAAINQLGANDELIFDGAAHLALPSGACFDAPRFSDEIRLIDPESNSTPKGWTARAPDPDEHASLWSALTLGVRDYARKTGFRGAVLGLSGGIDSALTAALASAALGAGNVIGISMPSRYSSEGSVTDAKEQAARSGLRLLEIPIESPHAACETVLGPAFEKICAELGLPDEPGVTEENVQSRLRGLTVMAISNKTGFLPLTTGNKSEMAVGYSTLYGDMNGGLAPLADLYKTRVASLSRWINDHPERAGFERPPIPEAVLRKPPSAELRPDQTDQDTLPPYEQLDAALRGLIEQRMDVARTAEALGVPLDVVERAAQMLARNEYKRKQMPTGLKVTAWAFGTGRRIPIVKPWEAARPAAAGKIS